MRRSLAVALVIAASATPALAEDVIHQRRLDNGLEVLVVEKKQAPIVTIEIAVKTGAFTEDRETNGLSHLYEHMFFKGNAAIPTQEAYMKRIQELGIAFNGTTGDERVNYFITLPSKSFAAGMKFMADALHTPLFNQEEMEKERLVVAGEYDRVESQNNHYLRRDMAKALYGDDAIRKNAIGIREVINRATRETMVAFKNTFYVPNNALLTIVGDVNRTEAQALVEKHFGPTQWKEGEDPHVKNRRAPMPRLEASKAVVTTRDQVAIPVLAVTWNGPDTDRDPRATLVADVWGGLVAQRSGRFQKAFRDGGLATSAALGYATRREGGEIYFQAQLQKPVTDVREALLKEIASMVEDATYWNDEQLENAKNSLRVGRAYDAQSGLNLTHTLSFNWASASLDYYRTYLDETARVTLDEVREFVKGYIAARPYVIGALVTAKDNKLDPATLLGTPPEQRSDPMAAAVTTFQLESGVKVIARKDAGLEIASLQVFIDGGAAFLTKETQGIERLALLTALEGSKDFPRDEQRKTLERLGARLGTEANYDYSAVGVQAPKDVFLESAGVLASCLREPELAAQAVDQRKKETLAGLKREKENPDNHVRLLANQLLYAGHPCENRVDGTPETVEKLDADAMRRALSEALTAGRVTIVFVTPFEQAEVQKFATDLFGWVKKAEGGPARATVGPAHPKERSIFEKKQTETTYMRGQFVMPGPGEPGFAAARVLMTILSQRLWEEVRTKRALSYAPGAGIAQTRANYAMVAASTKDPKQTLEVMNAEIAKLKEKLIEPADIRNIVNGDITGKAQRAEGAAAHAISLGRAELLSGGWQRFYDETADLARVTPEQVRDAARKLLVEPRWAFVGPEPVEEKLLGGN